MMFGQPQFLPLLALASLPLLIHLLARRQRRIVKFSMTRFLQEVTQQTHGRRWLRELLILLLRTGVVLFALLTLVRPYATINLPLPPAPISIAIIIDNSLSMQSGMKNGQVWFERALKWCERAMRDLPAEMALLTAEKASEPICEFTGDLQRLTKALKQVQPTFKALDLTPALQTADTLLSHRPAAVKRIVAITDLQSEPLRSLHPPKLSNPMTVIDVKPSEQVGNVRLNAKLILPLDPNAEGSVVSELQNLSRQSLKGKVRASVYEKTFAQTEVSLQPQGRKALTLQLPSWVLDAANERGLVQVEVRWESDLDIFGWDDFVRFEFRSPKRIRVVNAVRQGRQFVDAALRATNLVPISTANLSNADVIISSAPNDTKIPAKEA
ncbi:MAG: vWA domain-containing protein [Armatimonadota bacterium]